MAAFVQLGIWSLILPPVLATTYCAILHNIVELPTPTGCPHGLLESDVAQGPPHPHGQNLFKMAKGQDAAFPFWGANDAN